MRGCCLAVRTGGAGESSDSPRTALRCSFAADEGAVEGEKGGEEKKIGVREGRGGRREGKW